MEEKFCLLDVIISERRTGTDQWEVHPNHINGGVTIVEARKELVVQKQLWLENKYNPEYKDCLFSLRIIPFSLYEKYKDSNLNGTEFLDALDSEYENSGN